MLSKNEKRKIVIGFIPLSLLFVLLIIVLHNDTKSEVTNDNQTETVVSENSNLEKDEGSNINNDENSDTNIQSDDSDTILTLDSYRCRGCGRCAAIDPEHFEINKKTATIISQENLDSTALSSAILSCPEDAITLG